MAVIDVVTFNGEHEMFELRYQILKDYVDQFIVIEFDKTFSGKPKEKTFNKFYDKVTYYFIEEEVYQKYMDLALSSPNTIGADHWKREFCQKEALRECLDLQDDDLVFIGDVDEVWDSRCIGTIGKLRLKVYTYYLNNRSSEDFYGTICYPYKHIKSECLNHLRSNSPKDDHFNGWHFTSLGGSEALKKKLTDSYTEDSYATKEVLEGLDERYGSRDFLGRNFTYTLDESEWPQYLKDHKEDYKHLCL